MKNFKVFLVLCGFVMLTACSSVRKVDPMHITPQTKYNVAEVKVKLNARCEGKTYPTEAELNKIFKSEIEKEFCSKKDCAAIGASDVIDIDINIGYRRTFMAEGLKCSEAYGNGSMIYRYDLKKNGITIFSMAESEEMVVNKGFIGNLGSIATQLSASGDATDELDTIQRMSKGIATDIANKID